MSKKNKPIISNNNNCACDHLVELTEQQDIERLRQTMLAAASSMFSDTLVSIVDNPVKIEQMDKQVTTAISLRKDERSIGWLTFSRQLDNHEQSALSELLSVYQNQYDLLTRVNVDQLTSLGNRQALEQKFLDYFKHNNDKSRRKKDFPCCIALIDIDHFKRINDKFGHLYGDEVLLLVSQIMQSSFRDKDLLYRYGGEEFIAILDDTELPMAHQILSRLCEKIRSFNFPQVGTVTVSIGYTLMAKEINATSMIEKADKAMYYSKSNGRDQIHCYEQLISDGQLVAQDSPLDDITLF